MVITGIFPKRKSEFKPRLKLLSFPTHPLRPQDGTVPPSTGKRRPAPMFSLLLTLWKCDCISWPLWGDHHEGFFALSPVLLRT